MAYIKLRLLGGEGGVSGGLFANFGPQNTFSVDPECRGDLG